MFIMLQKCSISSKNPEKKHHGFHKTFRQYNVSKTDNLINGFLSTKLTDPLESFLKDHVTVMAAKKMFATTLMCFTAFLYF